MTSQESKIVHVNKVYSNLFDIIRESFCIFVFVSLCLYVVMFLCLYVFMSLCLCVFLTFCHAAWSGGCREEARL